MAVPDKVIIFVLVNLVIQLVTVQSTAHFVQDEDYEYLQGSQQHIKHCSTTSSSSLSVFSSLRRTTGQLEGAHSHSSVQTCKVYGTVANCSYAGFKRVPEDLPRNITELNLRNNDLTTIPDNAFARYPHLIKIKLVNNRIITLSRGSFQNLDRLLHLDLDRNCLEMNNNSFPSGVFCPLKSLKKLKINRNNDARSDLHLEYPDEALSCLSNLTELSMDGLPTDRHSFGRGFKKLTNLNILKLRGFHKDHCRLLALNSSTFANFEYLVQLILTDCYIKGENVSEGAFQSLKKLEMLDISDNEQILPDNLKNIFKDLGTLENMTSLHMRQIINRHSTATCLTWKHLEFFPKQLKTLVASDNNFEAVNISVIKRMDWTIEELDLRGNAFVLGIYLQELNNMTSLKRLYVGGSGVPYNIPESFPFREVPLPQSPYYFCNTNTHEFTSFFITLPPNLKLLDVSKAGMTYIITELNVTEKNVLETLNLEANHFPELRGPIRGLSGLKNLKLSSNWVTFISHEFFKYFSELENLDLSINNLGDCLAKDTKGKIFSNLSNLQVLDLSGNDIYQLPKCIFQSLNNLTTLHLNKTQINSFDVQLNHMHRLAFLNFAETYLQTLPVSTRHHIDVLSGDIANVTVNMTHTPIACDCKNMDFIVWLVNTKALFFIFGPFSDYRCDTGGGLEYRIVDGYEETLTRLNRDCISKALLFCVTGFGTSSVLLFILCVIIYRFRWNIRYMYYGAYLRFKDLTTRQKSFEYDAFICYATEDWSFAEQVLDKELRDRGLKILIHRRDFSAGEFVTSNIVKAVSTSRRTIVVLTNDLLDSHWCRYEIEMAKMENLYTGRQVLIFLIMECIARSKLNRELLYNLNNNTYQEYPLEGPQAEPAQMKLWWDKLALDIRA